MDTKGAFAKALKQTRIAKGLTQEDFSVASSRTYLSLLERAQKSPTLEKIDALADTMEIHPLTLLALTYLYAKPDQDLSKLLEKISKEAAQILSTKTI